MYQEPIFLNPVFKERIWGGNKLHKDFGYEIPSNKTGEVWVISAHANGPSIIKNGPLKGKTLLDAWNENRSLFNQQYGENTAYPLLIKIIDANDQLSVQVHPGDKYAQEKAGEPYGKTECWYVLSAEENAELILGHHAKTKEEFDQLIKQGKWNELLRKVKVKAGDFIYVPSGTIHAIGKGIVILETQQSSDITYRLYDYDRTGADGNKRELHLEQAKAVSTIPHQDPILNQTEEQREGLTEKKLVEETYFTVYHWNLQGNTTVQRTKDFLQISVIDGKAKLTTSNHTFEIKKGDHFIIPTTMNSFHLSGNAEFIVSHT